MQCINNVKSVLFVFRRINSKSSELGESGIKREVLRQALEVLSFDQIKNKNTDSGVKRTSTKTPTVTVTGDTNGKAVQASGEGKMNNNMERKGSDDSLDISLSSFHQQKYVLSKPEELVEEMIQSVFVTKVDRNSNKNKRGKKGKVDNFVTDGYRSRGDSSPASSVRSRSSAARSVDDVFDRMNLNGILVARRNRNWIQPPDNVSPVE